MDITWRKSSYSTSNGGACIEVGTRRKSSYSTSNGGSCVEVAATPWVTSPASGTNGGNRAESATPWVTSPHRGSNGGDRAEAAAPLLGRSPDGDDNSGEFVEVGAAPWRKSTHSTTNGGSCVETATIGAAVAVRDTRDNGEGPVLRFTPGAWQSFTATLK